MRIGDFLKRRKDTIEIENSIEYKRITIKTKHQGIFLRDVAKGILIGTKLQFIVNKGQFLLSKIDARLGAFGIVPEDLDKAIITGNFWAFDVDKSKVNIEWLNLFTSSGNFYEICDQASSGTTHRKYLDEKKFLNFEIEIPNINSQSSFIKQFKSYKIKYDKLVKEISSQEKNLQLLRQAILQEAVQGKLTKQNSDDEPAAKQLQRIKTEKQQLIAAGKLKKEKELPPVTKDEIPYELPKGWVWCRLGEIINLVSGVTLGKTYKEELIQVPYLRVANVQRGYVNFTQIKELSVPKSEIEKYALKKGDLIMIEGGDWDKVGRCAIWNAEIEPCIHQNHIFRLRFYGNISNQWGELFLNSPVARRYFESCSKQTTNLASINKTQLTNLLFALPPLSEQHRIVYKVQRLLEMINQLELQVTHGETQTNSFLRVVLTEAFASKKDIYAENEIITLAAER